MADQRTADRRLAENQQAAALAELLGTHFSPVGGGGGGLPRDEYNRPIAGLYVETNDGVEAFLPTPYLQDPFEPPGFEEGRTTFPEGDVVEYRFAETIVAGPINLNDIQIKFPQARYWTTREGEWLRRGQCTVRVRDLGNALRTSIVNAGGTYVTNFAAANILIKTELAEPLTAYAGAHIFSAVAVPANTFTTVVNTAKFSGSCTWQPATLRRF